MLRKPTLTDGETRRRRAKRRIEGGTGTSGYSADRGVAVKADDALTLLQELGK
jgi:hypothetical protein